MVELHPEPDFTATAGLFLASDILVTPRQPVQLKEIVRVQRFARFDSYMHCVSLRTVWWSSHILFVKVDLGLFF